MSYAERVAGHVGGEAVVAAGLFQRRGTAATSDDGGWPPASTRNARRRGSRPTPSSCNLPRPRTLDPDVTDWDTDDMDTWAELIVMVADDEDFADWQRDWLADNGRG